MHRNGWVVPLFCTAIGLRMAGWALALPIGGLLVLSLLVHECGHMLAATLLRVPVREFGLRATGAYIRRGYATRRRDEILISLAGPTANLLFALPLYAIPHLGYKLALSNLLLAGINLLPIPASDGLRIAKVIWTPTAPGIMSPASKPTQSHSL